MPIPGTLIHITHNSTQNQTHSTHILPISLPPTNRTPTHQPLLFHNNVTICPTQLPISHLLFTITLPYVIRPQSKPLITPLWTHPYPLEPTPTTKLPQTYPVPNSKHSFVDSHHPPTKTLPPLALPQCPSPTWTPNQSILPITCMTSHPNPPRPNKIYLCFYVHDCGPCFWPSRLLLRALLSLWQNHLQ